VESGMRVVIDGKWEMFLHNKRAEDYGCHSALVGNKYL